MKYLIALIVILIFFNAGCTMQNTPAQKPRAQQQSSNKDVPADVELAGNVKNEAQKVNAVEDAVAVALGGDISVAVRVTGFDRLRLKTIRKEVHERITQMAPGYQVHVTTDKKLYSELEKLNSQIQQGGDPIRLKAELDKINESMRG